MRMDFLPAAVLKMHPIHNKYGPIMSLCTEGSAALHNRCWCACVINNSCSFFLFVDFPTHSELWFCSLVITFNCWSISNIPPPLLYYLLIFLLFSLPVSVDVCLLASALYCDLEFHIY